jgi:hypothetical protein
MDRKEEGKTDMQPEHLVESHEGKASAPQDTNTPQCSTAATVMRETCLPACAAVLGTCVDTQQHG